VGMGTRDCDDRASVARTRRAEKRGQHAPRIRGARKGQHPRANGRCRRSAARWCIADPARRRMLAGRAERVLVRQQRVLATARRDPAPGRPDAVCPQDENRPSRGSRAPLLRPALPPTTRNLCTSGKARGLLPSLPARVSTSMHARWRSPRRARWPRC
jgi:hypothetical protein